MERDDLIINDQYPLDAHHSEEKGKEIRKRIWKVTAILTIITTVEVYLGITVTDRVGMTWETVKWSFIILTLVKAGYIVLAFMHLGDERKNFKWIILAPYIFFILYLIFICLLEASYIYNVLSGLKWW